MPPVLTLPVPPSANNYWRSCRGRVFKSKEAIQYKETAQYLAKKQGFTEPLTGALSVSMRFYRERKSGDLDNRFKCLFDSLNGILWKDDSQIVEIHAYRFDDKNNPRIELNIKEVSS